MTKEQFEQTYRQYYPKMYRLAKSLLYDADESKDVVSDVFARLLQGKMLLREDKTEGFLMTCVRNECRNILRHKEVRERVARLFASDTAETSNSPFDAGDERLERLMSFVEKELPELSQRIFRLRFLREMTYQDIAENTGVSRVTVYNHLSQSLSLIKEYFSENEKQ